MRAGFDWDRFQRKPLVAILRGCATDAVPHLVKSLAEGGLTSLEFTFNDPVEAAVQVRLAREILGDRGHVGAGTVTDLNRLRTALDAGASFIVTPCLNLSVVAECVARGVPVFPGVLSIHEIVAAQDRGVRCVKLFPADRVGPGFVSRVKEVLPEMGIMPTGGVSLDTVAAWKRAGADALGVGTPLLDPALIAAGDWDGLRRRALAFVDEWSAA